jgi:uncharacterized protein DUF1353
MTFHAGLALPLSIVFLSLSSRGYAQQPIAPVDFTPFADGKNWIVKQPLVYRVGISRDSIVVPIGFVTDFASIPPVLQSIIQQNGPYQLPALVHDYLYWNQTCTRKQADKILLLAMTEHHVKPAHQTAIYDAVRAAGQFAWDGNARERTQGLPRILPSDRLHIPALMNWATYRMQLLREGVRDGRSIAVPKGFCARGSMTVKAALDKP